MSPSLLQEILAPGTAWATARPSRRPLLRPAFVPCPPPCARQSRHSWRAVRLTVAGGTSMRWTAFRNVGVAVAAPSALARWGAKSRSPPNETQTLCHACARGRGTNYTHLQKRRAKKRSGSATSSDVSGELRLSFGRRRDQLLGA